MTRSWTDMARTGLAAARLWRASPDRRGPGGDLSFTAVDIIVLSLLAGLREVDGIVCADAGLRAALEPVFARTDPPLRLLAVPESTPHLRLSALADLAGPAAGETVVAHGMGQGFTLSAWPREAGGLLLLPLSSAAPALWQCGLALVAAEPGRAAMQALVADLARTMHGDWIDPLALYERVQQLSGQTPGFAAEDGEAAAERIAELEHELAALKRAALVSQHLLLVDAVERARSAP